jgi:hypothetical protein
MIQLKRLAVLCAIALALGTGTSAITPTGVLAGPGPSICC